MIDLERVTYRYPDREAAALNRFDLTVEEGETLLVAGPSGSGKSTLLRALNGLVPHFHGGALQGRARVGGRDPAALGPRGMSDIAGFATQDPEAHFVAEIVEDELAFAMENHGVKPAVMRRRVEEALDLLSIAHLRRRRIDTLSGGERQRVAIAAVLTLQPALLILDEPTSQLDPQAAEDVLNALRRLNEDLGMTVVLSEHRVERAASHVDRALLLQPDAPPNLGLPGEALAGSPLAPPITRLGAALGWRPPPLTVKQARRHPSFASTLAALEAASTAAPDQTAPEPAVRVNQLWTRYPNGIEALTGLSFAAPRGRLTALMGRNGSGKSTLLKTLAGLIKPARGSAVLVRRDGAVIDPAAQPPAATAQTVGFVPQHAARLLFHETVREELAFSLRAQEQPEPAIERWLTRFGLANLRDAHPRDLSVGERQRLALAAILAGEPDILLLDEPTRGLDATDKTRLAELLRALCDQGVSVLMATHDVELAADCADRVALLGEGRLAAEGSIREVMNESMTFSTQINKLLRAPCWLTERDVLQALRP